jgi:hypothetical protein
MFYDAEITVPHATAKSAPVTGIIHLTTGIIHRVEVGFPIGTRALVHCVLLYHEHQVWPTNPDNSFHWDGYTIAFDEWYPIDTEPYDLKVVAWSDADTYDYHLAVRIGVLREEVLQPFSGVMGALKKFLRYVGIGA